MRSEISWAELIWPVTETEFEQSYFGKRPLKLKRRFHPETGLETLDRWRAILRGQTPMERQHRVMVVIDPEVDEKARLDPHLATAINAGGPLIVDKINLLNPQTHELARTIAKGLGSFVGVNAYVSPRGKDALDLHYDNHDVVVIQLAGTKQWILGTKLVRGVAGGRYFDTDTEALREQAKQQDTFRTIETESGDFLYIPRGLFHRATSTADFSVHISFGIRRPTGLDFADLLVQRLVHEVQAREYCPKLSPDDENAALRAYLDDLTERIGNLARAPEQRDAFVEAYRKRFDGQVDEV